MIKSFITRWFGGVLSEEVVEYLLDPVMKGVYDYWSLENEKRQTNRRFERSLWLLDSLAGTVDAYRSNWIEEAGESRSRTLALLYLENEQSDTGRWRSSLSLFVCRSKSLFSRTTMWVISICSMVSWGWYKNSSQSICTEINGGLRADHCLYA